MTATTWTLRCTWSPTRTWRASERPPTAAPCLGHPGWVILYGNVPEHRQCEVCLSRTVPKLPKDLTEAQLDGRACIRCGAEGQPMRPTEAWSRQSSQLFECVDVEACAERVKADA